MRTFLLLACFLAFIAAAEPGRATPAAAATSGTYKLLWTGEFEGNKTEIIIGSAVGNRNLALVITKDSEDNLLATYPAVAFLDAEKTLHVDGRGAPLKDDSENGYSPDSFAISTDGKVKLMDDGENSSEAKLTSSPQVEATP